MLEKSQGNETSGELLSCPRCKRWECVAVNPYKIKQPKNGTSNLITSDWYCYGCNLAFNKK